MARLPNGILGGIKGSIGPLVGYRLGDQDVVRAKPRARAKFTPAELANQAKFKRIQQHLEPIKELLKVGFSNYYTKTGGYRAAVAYTHKHAIISDENGIRIDPHRFKISGGDLLPLASPRAEIQAPDQIRISWDSSGITHENADDQVLIAIHDPLTFQAVEKIYNGGHRKDGQTEVTLPPTMSNLNLNIYIGVVAADRSAQSDSQYLGSFKPEA
ncbi:hypothetical protein D9M68_690900 [compost metagenome]